jgi:hypothetical protein
MEDGSGAPVVGGVTSNNNSKKRKRMLGAEGNSYIEGQMANTNPNRFIATFQKTYSLSPQNDKYLLFC